MTIKGNHIGSSWWHLPKIILMFTLMASLWYLLFKGMWLVHLYFYPDHTNQLSMFWQEGLSAKAFISSFLLLIPLFFPAIGLAMIISNSLFWLIPPARQIFELEAKSKSRPGFTGSQSRLLLVLFKYLLPFGLGLSLLGAYTLKSLI